MASSASFLFAYSWAKAFVLPFLLGQNKVDTASVMLSNLATIGMGFLRGPEQLIVGEGIGILRLVAGLLGGSSGSLLRNLLLAPVLLLHLLHPHPITYTYRSYDQWLTYIGLHR